MSSGNKMPIHRGLFLAPMIDVVFLLLAVYMVSSSLDRLQSIPLDLARSEGVAITNQKAIVLNLNEKNQIIAGQRRLKPKELPAYINQQSAPGQARVRLQIDRRASFEFIAPVLGVLQNMKLESLRLITRPEH